MAQVERQVALTMEVYRGNALLQREVFTERSVTIGSGPAAMLVVAAPELAELHAVVTIEDDGAISLIGLANDGEGLVHGGARVTEATLRANDEFQVGAITVRVAADVVPDDEDVTYVAANTAGLQAAVAASQAAHAAQAAAPADHGSDDHGADADEATDHGDIEEHGEEEEDLVPYLMSTKPAVGVKERFRCLEVNQVWGNALIESRQFRTKGTDPIRLGAHAARKWHLLGVDMGWVPRPLGAVLPWMMPLWSDVETEWRTDFYVPRSALPEESDWVLFDHPEDGKFVARVPAGWTATAIIGDATHSLDELVSMGRATAADGGHQVPMTDDLQLKIDGGGMSYYTRIVQGSPMFTPRLGGDADYAFMAMIVFGIFLFGVAQLAVYMAPHSETESSELDERFVELLLEQPEPEKDQKKPDKNPDAGEGKKAKKEEGKVGKKDAKIEKAKGNKIEIKKLEIDRQVAENAGVLGAMQNSELDAMFGQTGLSSDLRGGIGGLIGANGTQFGSGGLGGRGSGLGGGGTAEGLGGLGTKGMGSGASGYGSGGGSFGAKGEGGIGTVGGDPIILGALDRSLIDEVIKRHMNQIRYCYQRELTKNPALGGKVVIKFVIAKDGTVSSASVKSTTMNNAAVESCISGRFMRMQFPEPKGGGIVIVSYPFIFSPG